MTKKVLKEIDTFLKTKGFTMISQKDYYVQIYTKDKISINVVDKSRQTQQN